ncbi:hypothetical protein KAU33_04575 [Candidatus Dependentiae bacterium]|nr:hypothetical protein [Candidatus Dependentiae bacterium]
MKSDNNLKDKKKKKTFVEYERSEDGALKEKGKFKGDTPSQASRKAIMQQHRDTGETEDIQIILREAGKVNANGIRKLRLYVGRVKDDILIDPKMGKHQHDLAIKRGSWVVDEQGIVQTVFDDGYDSSDDPILQGRRPLYKAKRAVSSYKGLEDMPNVKLTGLK